MQNKLKQIRDEAIEKINAAGELDKLNEIKVAFLGKKGELTAIMKSMKDIPRRPSCLRSDGQ